MSFLAPKPKKPTPTPAAPTIDDAAESLESRDKTRRRRGRAATILSGGDSGATVGAAQLLGS